MKRRGIIFFKTELDTLNLFSEEIAKGFSDLGIDIIWIDVRENLAAIGRILEYVEQYEELAAIDFNSAKFGLKTPEGQKVFEILGIYCINILVDHPYWYPEQLQNMPGYGAVICIDQNHMNYVNRFYPNISTVAFMPHGGYECVRNEDRPIDVFYAGSIYESLAEVQKPDWTKWVFDAEMICNNVVNYLLEHTGDTIEAVFEKILTANGIVLDEEQLREFISECAYVERIVSSYYRRMVVEALARHGIKLTICGLGWGTYDFVNLPNVEYIGMISPEQVLEKMASAKMVLNTMPWFKCGSHERVYNAMLNGAVLISEENEYLKENLPKDGWIGYPVCKEAIEELPERITSVLQNENKWKEMKTIAYQYAADEQTWRSRGTDICKDLLMWN